MGLLAGQMLYRWKMDLVLVTVLAVFVTLGSIAIGARGIRLQEGTGPDGKPARALVYDGPINSVVAGLDDAINGVSGGGALYTVSDPTKADPRLAATTVNAQGTVEAGHDRVDRPVIDQ